MCKDDTAQALLHKAGIKIMSKYKVFQLKIRAYHILKGPSLSGWMKRAQNSDSETHVKK